MSGWYSAPQVHIKFDFAGWAALISSVKHSTALPEPLSVPVVNHARETHIRVSNVNIDIGDGLHKYVK